MSEERVKRDTAAWDVVAAALCFVAAVLSLAVGFVLTTRWLLDDHLHPLLHGAGLVLLVIGIPIMILGGHFMDLGERKHKHGNRRQAAVSR
jgi:cytochrome c biogenesis protein CcdA